MTKYHSYIIKIVSIVTLAAFIVTQCGLSYAFEPKSGPISSKLRQMQRMEQLASEVKDSGQAAPAPATGIVAPGEKAMPTAGEVGIANAVAAEDKTWLFGEGIIPYNPQARAEAVVENCPNRATKNLSLIHI